MREIEYRIWDIDNQKMYYLENEEQNDDVIWKIDKNGIYIQVIDKVNLPNADAYDFRCEVSFVTPKQILMPYIGFKDKNGVKIFEGDIVTVKSLGTRCTFVVYYSNGGFRIKNDAYPYFNRLTYIADNEIPIEVTGNIHENPKLLENKGI